MTRLGPKARELPVLSVIGAVAIAWTTAACELDASHKNACVEQSDCLAGYLCEDRTCKTSLGAPSLLVGTYEGTTSEYRLSWQDNAGAEMVFQVERSLGAEPYALLGTVPSGTTSYVTRFAKSLSYRFRVRAVNDTGRSGYSNEHVVEQPILTPRSLERIPSKPEVSKQPGAGAWPERVVLLGWKAVDFRGETDGCGYQIVVREPFGNTHPWNLVATLPQAATSYQITSEDLSFECEVVAFSTYGELGSDVIEVSTSDFPQPW